MIIKSFQSFESKSGRPSLEEISQNIEDMGTIRDILDNEELEYIMESGRVKNFESKTKQNEFVFGITINMNYKHDSNKEFVKSIFIGPILGFINMRRFNNKNPTIQRIKKLTGYSMFEFSFVDDYLKLTLTKK